MALLFADGFDHYVTGDLTRKWSATSTSTPIISTANPRYGAQHLRSSSLSTQYLIKAVPQPVTLIAGAAVNPAAFPTGGNSSIITFLDGTLVQASLRVTGSGLLTVIKGSSTVLATSTTGISAGNYSYVEMKVLISSTVGTVQVKVNGTTVINATGLNTQSGSNTYIDGVFLGPHISSGNFNTDYDDFYICDTTGSTNNDFLGDVRIEALYPSGAGSSTTWTPSTGSNYTCVDEATANITDYVTSTANDQIDTYAFGDLAEAAGSVKGIQINALAQKTDTAVKHIALIDRTASTDHISSDIALSTSWQYVQQIVETDSGNGGIAWTVANVNAAQFGVKSRA